MELILDLRRRYLYFNIWPALIFYCCTACVSSGVTQDALSGPGEEGASVSAGEEGNPQYLGMVLAKASGVTQIPPMVDDRDQVKQFKKAKNLIREKKPAEAIDYLDKIIKFYESAYTSSDLHYYCSRSDVETLLYSMQSATNSESAAILPSTWADAYHMKGFALIDLGRTDVAQVYLNKAVSLSPQNAMYLAELGYTYQFKKQYKQSMGVYKRAETAAREFSPESDKIFELTAALRGQAYALIETGHLDEAEKLYHECLELNPEDKNALRELKYIEQLRKRAASN